MFARRAMIAAVVAAFGVAGCDDGATPPAMDMCETGEEYFYVVNALTLPIEESEGIVAGVNIDGVTSTETGTAPDDTAGCYQQDFTSPGPDHEAGVDNQLGPLLASDVVSGLLDVQAAMTDGVKNGDVLVLVRVSHVDSLVEDTCVNVDVMLGYNALTACTDDTQCMLAGWECNDVVTTSGTSKLCTPGLDSATSMIKSGTTFDINGTSLAASGQARAHAEATIAAGRLKSETIDLDLALPFGTDCFALAMSNTQIRFDITATSISNGILGGQLNIDALVNEINKVYPGQGDLARTFLRGDLAPSAATPPVCADVSIGLTLTGVTAIEGATQPGASCN